MLKHYQVNDLSYFKETTETTTPKNIVDEIPKIFKDSDGKIFQEDNIGEIQLYSDDQSKNTNFNFCFL